MNSKNVIEFYRSLGKLFYVFAATDNCVRPEEFKALETIINEEWLSLNNEAKYILETFKQLQSSEETDLNICFESFVDFKKAHIELFNINMNSKILKTATTITTSFSGQNKSELILLAKLDLELKKEI